MRFKWMLAAGMTLTMVALGQKSTSPEVMLGAGLHQEEVEANCKEAIKIYQKVVAEKSAPRSVAGRAQLHIGICQEKLGQREARIAYEAARSRYADLPEIVAEAQSRIAGLGGGEAMVARRLATRNEIEYDTLSTDGQWLGGTDRITGDLIMTHTATLETRRLVHGTLNEIGPGQPSYYGESPILSPDQRQVAYLWFDGYDHYFGVLRVMPNEPGAKSRALTGDEYVSPIPQAWSHDGKSILVTFDTKPVEVDPITWVSVRKIAWISVSEGSVTVIKSFDFHRGSGRRLALSPNGKYIAYSAQVSEDSPDRRIYVISAEDGAPLWDISLGDINEEPVWTADGSQLLLSSNSSGTFSLWSVPVREGKKVGAPALLTSGPGRKDAIGMSPSGTFFLKTENSDYQIKLSQIFVANLEQGEALARGGALIEESLVGVSPSWSRDGKWIAFYRSNDVVIRSMSNGMEWAFSSDRGYGQNIRPRWYRDGRLQRDKGGVEAEFETSYEISNGQPREAKMPSRLPREGALSPDDKTLYRKWYRKLETGGPNNSETIIEVIDVATGKLREQLTVPGNLVDFAVSPDGNTFCIVNRPDPKGPNRLALMGMDGSEFRYFFSGVSLLRTQVAWTPDGRSILFVQEDNERSRIMRISVEGGQPEFTGISVPVLTSFDLSPDGSRIVYAADSTNSEVWALDNLLGIKKRAP